MYAVLKHARWHPQDRQPSKLTPNWRSEASRLHAEVGRITAMHAIAINGAWDFASCV